MEQQSFSIHVQYCGGWGYEPKFQKFKSECEKAFAGVVVDGAKDPGTTGNFTVTVVKGETRTQVHHKQTDGDVKAKDIAGVLQKIRDALWSIQTQGNLWKGRKNAG